MVDRRREIENIIVGTLMESDGETNYFDSCRSMLSADMMSDPVNRRIYGYVEAMNAKGKTDTRPHAIFDEYGAEVMDILAEMCELVNEWSFVHKKTWHNERLYLASLLYNVDVEYSNVKFEDYVAQLIRMSYDKAS